MTDETLVLQFAKLSLNSGRSAAEVCAARPDLLEPVRKLLEGSRRLESRLESLFPKAPSPVVVHSSRADRNPEFPQIPGYQIESILGRGGIGIVYRARHLALDRPVALKMLLSGPYAAPAELERFKREAAAMARLQHCHIVQVFDFGDVEGRPFLAMELLESKTLAQKLANAPLPARETATWMVTLANAMQAAHQAGIIHRDLKPANILLTADDQLKIADFGLARHSEGESLLTFPGDRLGTPSYMAPEQAVGRLDLIGPPADIYSLGAILYESLTGRPPFRAENPAETVRQLIHDEPVSPSRLNSLVPRDLETITLHCLRKDPTRRYAVARELAEDLERFLRCEPILARPIGRLEQAGLWVRRHQGLAAALAGVAALMLTLLLVTGIAASHFRRVELEQRGLRELAEERGEGLRRSLYGSEMNLCSQTLPLPGAIGRVNEWLAHWTNSKPDLRDWEWYHLYGLCHRDLQTLEAPSGGVLNVQWSSDGKHVATAGEDHAVRIWDTATGRELHCLRGHRREVLAVAWHPSGSRLASASWDGTIKLWEVGRDQATATLQRGEAEVHTVAWHPTGRSLAAGSKDGVISLWNAESGELTRELQGHSQTVFSVAWHPHAERLASGGEDGSVRMWDLSTEEAEVIQTAGHTNWVRRVAWRPDGNQLASAGHDQVCKIWDGDDGNELRTLHGHTQALASVDWSPDGNRLVTAAEDQTLRLWTADRESDSICLRGHTKSLTAAVWSPNGERLASASLDGKLKIWDAAITPESRSLPQLTGGVNALAWSPNGRRLAVAGQDGRIQVWNSLSAEMPLELEGHQGTVHSIAWSPDGNQLVTAGADRTVRVWQADSGRELRSFDGAEAVLTAAWHPDGNEIAFAGKERVIHMWNVETERETQALVGHTHWIYALAWNNSGRQLASASGDGTLRIWEAASGKPRVAQDEYVAELKCVAWSNDGRRLATAGNNQTVDIYAAATGEKLQTLRGHTQTVNGVAWNSTGTRLVSVSSDRTAKIWAPDSGQSTFTLGTYDDHAQAVAWTSDGNAVAVGCRDGSVFLYDTATGDRLR